MKIKEIQSIIKDFEESSLMTLEIEMEDFKLKLSKQKNNEQTSNQLIKVNEQTVSIETNPNIQQPNQTRETIQSPLVGTFFAASSPDTQPFVKVGQKVKKGQVVCIVEAMKIMNEIVSPKEGIIKEILVLDGAAVGYEQPLMVIEESS
jgi:acetyl-CoA carboxylase biotin carboxyl carrier protein